MTAVVVDVFCGAGGLSAGLRAAGLEVRAGVDVDSNCAWAYEHNVGAEFVEADVAALSGNDLASFFEPGMPRVLAGCAPCQPFTAYGRMREQADDRLRLLGEFGRLVGELRPEALTMENVPGLASHGLFKRFLGHLDDLGYKSCWDVVACELFGVPQRRRRLVVIASRVGPVRLPRPKHDGLRTVGDAIRDLPHLLAGESQPDDPLHAAAGLSLVNVARVRASRPGGTWREWPAELIPPCRARASGAKSPAMYGRMAWDRPAPTITTQFYNYGSGRFGHPEQDRAISLREGALLQSFPADWRFAPEGRRIEFASLGRIIGNAVPPRLGAVIGLELAKALQEDGRSREAA